MYILNWITQNTNLIGLIIVSFSGIFIFVKWIDTRKREIKEKRYIKYMELVSIISGNRPDSTCPNLTEQIAAIWFLLEYKEYHEITVKIFSKSDLKNMANASWVSHVLPHIKALIQEIS